MKTITAGLLLVLLGIGGPIACGENWQFFINLPSAAIARSSNSALILLCCEHDECRDGSYVI